MAEDKKKKINVDDDDGIGRFALEKGSGTVKYTAAGLKAKNELERLMRQKVRKTTSKK